MLSTPENHQAAAESASAGGASPDKETRKRRVHRKKPGQRGKFLVLFMAFLILANIGLSAFLSFTGSFHPFIENLERVTVWIAYGLVAFVVSLCLIRLYRGSVSIKQVTGGFGIVAACGFSLLATLSVLNELPLLWVAHDALGAFTGIFAAWVCFYSKTASRFLTLQADKPH